ncbi:PREDICTED: uncharacterized protein LOC109344533 [Lupinus angustifolius]|uniref:uncharacterized protein LOC109344533 n=1 Tax=Lupinus angustifolius TaxID=3871 RepID=UPI00092F400F|nr:PREDICTED: uncharacterized protein LOC109344533 [Lupinus angustifolius]
MRARLEYAKALDRKHGEQIAELMSQLGHNRNRNSSPQEGRGSWGERSEETLRREKWRTLEIPIFAGEDAFGWTHRLERYFVLKEVTEEEKMQATVMAMEGKALSWFHWWEKCNPSPTWDGFKIAVTGTVEEYVEDFEKYVGALRSIDQECVRGIFLNGLKEELQAEVKLYELQSLSDMIQKVLLIEQKNMLITKKIHPAYIPRGSRGSRSNSYTKTVTMESKPNTDRRWENSAGSNSMRSLRPSHFEESVKNKSGEFKHLTNVEIREKREKGLCFRCDEPYNREHKCRNKQLRIILVKVDEEGEGNEEGEEQLQTFKSLHLSLFSMTGFTTTRSWKVEGWVDERSMIILIDCGASHNFIVAEMVKKLQLKVVDTPAYWVEVGDGHKVRCKGKCEHLKFQQKQQLNEVQDFYLFNLKGVDMVLGLDWLAQLGEVKADFGRLELTMKRGNEWIKISGNPALARTELPFGALMQILKEEGEGLLIQCESVQSEEIPPTSLGPILNLLAEFEELFVDPKELPYIRRCDHAIHLIEEATIPNLRPYKYPHYQKTEIERLVGEMLESGVIRHSISPYSSPIILVKKKDGGWRFCVDYRALNRITIPNKFPIPIIEELLDEIGGANALMNEVLRPFLRQFALVFFDDILIYSKGEAAHQEHLRLVLDIEFKFLEN